MNSALQKYLEAATGLTNLTTAKAEQIVKQLVRSGEAASDQVGEMVDDLLDRQRGNREAATALVRSETTRAVRAMGLATSSEVERLQKQVADLKRELRRAELEGDGLAAVARPTSGPAPTTTGAKESGAKKTAKKTAKKSAAKKTAKKSGAKKTAKTSGAKKTAKKSGAKKTAKKSGAKKSGAKKSGAKKTAKKTGAKKSGAKKTAKKSTS